MDEKPRKTSEKSLLVATAETIGKAAAKVGALTGIKPQADLTDTTPPHKRQRLAAKKKGRLPRRQKKMNKKKAVNRSKMD